MTLCAHHKGTCHSVYPSRWGHFTAIALRGPQGPSVAERHLLRLVRLPSAQREPVRWFCVTPWQKLGSCRQTTGNLREPADNPAGSLPCLSAARD